MPESAALIRLEGITKRFGGLTALDSVTFGIDRGEVHAVVGENGAGKSTLMKILAGVDLPDEGRIFLRGEPVALSSPLAARRQGITVVFQDLNLFPHLTAAANIFVNRELTGSFGLLDERSMVEASRKAFEAMGVLIDPRLKVADLSVGEKQLVEIARTIQEQSSIIIMDEPNSALTNRESERLFELIQRLRGRGVTVLYVSHRLEEVFGIADRITVLRDGRYQGTWHTKETEISGIVAMMIGRRLEETFPERAPVPPHAPVLIDVQGLVQGTRLGPLSFQVRAGEILGFAGLEGSGVESVFGVLFGLERMTQGEVRFGGSSEPVRSPLEAIRQGLALIPRNRREEGLVMGWPVRKNATLVILERLVSLLGLVDHAAERRAAGESIRRLNVVTESLEKKVVHLSGGNQQKVVLAKWLAAEPRILLLNDPTRGVDVGAKAEIYRLCHELAQEGLAILFASSEIEEILGLCDRILAVYKGKIAREFCRGKATKGEVLEAIAGVVL